jgi:hypothetical protein
MKTNCLFIIILFFLHYSVNCTFGQKEEKLKPLEPSYLGVWEQQLDTKDSYHIIHITFCSKGELEGYADIKQGVVEKKRRITGIYEGSVVILRYYDDTGEKLASFVATLKGDNVLDGSIGFENEPLDVSHDAIFILKEEE